MSGFKWSPTETHHSPLPVGADAEDLAVWWYEIARADLEMLLPKATEYSAHDLRMTGDLLQQLLAGDQTKISPEELTCWFYLLSKCMRAIGAIKEGREPSDDTVQDIRVYATMITRIRDNGGWPR